MASQVVIKDIKAGDQISHEGEVMTVEKVEFSNIGKHGRSKARLELKDSKGEKKVLIRPADAIVEKQ